jgi:hypothetical protein
VLVLPDSENLPPCRLKATLLVKVALSVARDLRPPIAGVLSALSPTVLRATMPVAPVDKDSELDSGENDVGPDQTAIVNADRQVDAEPQAASMESPTKRELRSSIPSAV